MSSYTGLFPSSGGTRIAEFSVDVVTRGMERTLDQLDRLEERLEAVDKKLDEQAKAAPSRERELTGFLDKWGMAFTFIAGAATTALAAIVAASPELTASMSEMSYAFEWMAFVLGERLSPEFRALSEQMLKTAEDFDEWFRELPPIAQEAVSDVVLILGVSGLGAALGAAIAAVIPGVGLAMGGVYGAIIGAFIGLDMAVADEVNLQILGGLQLAGAGIGFLLGGPAGALAGAVIGSIIGGLLGFDDKIAEELDAGFVAGFVTLTTLLGASLGGPAGAVAGAVIGAIIVGLAAYWDDLTSWFETQWIAFLEWVGLLTEGFGAGEGWGSAGAGARAGPGPTAPGAVLPTGGALVGGGGVTIVNYSPTINITGAITPEAVPYLVDEISDVLERERQDLYTGVRPP